jgi:hypothetical protein
VCLFGLGVLTGCASESSAPAGSTPAASTDVQGTENVSGTNEGLARTCALVAGIDSVLHNAMNDHLEGVLSDDEYGAIVRASVDGYRALSIQPGVDRAGILQPVLDSAAHLADAPLSEWAAKAGSVTSARTDIAQECDDNGTPINIPSRSGG